MSKMIYPKDPEALIEVGRLIRQLAITQPTLSSDELARKLADAGVKELGGRQLNIAYDDPDELTVRVPSTSRIEQGIVQLQCSGKPSYYVPDDIKRRPAEDQVMYIIGRYVIGECGADG